MPKVMEVKPDVVVKLGNQDFPPEEWVEEVPKVYLGEYTQNSDVWIIAGKVILFIRKPQK